MAQIDAYDTVDDHWPCGTQRSRKYWMILSA
jgi:hypothetical protein